MQPRVRELLKILSLGLIILLTGSCFHLQLSPEHASASFSLNEKFHDIEKYLALYGDVESDGIYFNPGFFEVAKGEESPNSPIVTMDFIHISDVHLRDERAQLFSRFWSGLADKIVGSVRFGINQEKYDFSVFMSLLLGVDGYAENLKDTRPAFLIQTGDSVHVSLLSEAWEFLYILNQSLNAIPWFSVIGNHDVTIFGTPVFNGNSHLKNPGLSFLPINPLPEAGFFNAIGYMTLHQAGETVISGIPVRTPSGGVQDLDTFSPGSFDPSRTEFHGFDMLPSSFSRDHDIKTSRARPEIKGYYALDYTLSGNDDDPCFPEKIRVVVLNTSEYVSVKAEGGFSEEQVVWLRDLLNGLPNEKMRVIAFGHHPLIPKTGWMKKSGDQYERLTQVHDLFRKHVDVYFCGHSHKQGYSDEYGFLQVIAPSVMGFPQSGHKVKLMYGEKSLIVEVVAFSHAEMQHQNLLGLSLDRIVTIWEKDPDILQAVEKIIKVWGEDPNLVTRDITRIPGLWENSKIVKSILDRAVSSFGKVEEIKKAVRKAALLKQSYLARISAMEDAGEDDYLYLGRNLRFILPLK